MSRVARRYRVDFANSAARALRKIESPFQVRIIRRIDALAIDPRPAGVKKLAGDEGVYRVRVGDYRILYTIEDTVLLILVVAIGNRRDIYR